MVLFPHQITLRIDADLDNHEDLLKEIKRTVDAMLNPALGERVTWAEEDGPSPAMRRAFADYLRRAS